MDVRYCSAAEKDYIIPRGTHKIKLQMGRPDPCQGLSPSPANQARSGHRLCEMSALALSRRFGNPSVVYYSYSFSWGDPSARKVSSNQQARTFGHYELGCIVEM